MSEIASVNPARPAEVVASVVAATASDVDAAVARATAAQRELGARHRFPREPRSSPRAAKRSPARKAEVATLVSREAGKVLAEAAGDVQEAIDMAALRRRARAAPPWGETVPCEMPDKLAFTTRQPGRRRRHDHAVELPDRDPVVEDLPRAARRKRHRDQAVGARARVLRGVRRDAVAKPACPADLVQVVHGMGEVGAAITMHPGVRAVSFTGSVPTGPRGRGRGDGDTDRSSFPSSSAARTR